MRTYVTVEEHEANGPDAWRVVKVAERCWHLVDANGAVIQSCPTKRQAEADKVSGFHVRLWSDTLRHMRGENVRGWKPYAQVVAEREANDRWQAQRAAEKASSLAAACEPVQS